MDKIKIIFLGGQDENYKAMTAIEINNDIFVIECGVKFPDKTKPGVDYIIARYDYLIENKDKIRAYFLTHGHDSMIGGLPYIYEKCPAPVYGSLTTKEFLKGFCIHNHLNFDKIAYVPVNTSQDLVLSNRKIQLFQTASNFADSFGIAISTDQGNIIYLSNNVVHNDNDLGFALDKQKIARICSEKTLVLLLDSLNATRPGYCSPNYRLFPLIKKNLMDISGRIFLAIDSPDLFNIVDCLNAAIRNGKKIVYYDKDSKELVERLAERGLIRVDRNTIASIEDVNRIRPQELVIFITDFNERLNSKVALLASGNNDEKIVFLTKNDTFIYGNHVTPGTEKSATSAIDELSKTDCKIVTINQKTFLRMHACEEDIKSIIAMFRPKYFVPVTAPFTALLSSAKIAVNMNVGLNHNNVFIVDNGNILEFEAGFGKLSMNKVVSGDVFIDGKGIGDIGTAILEERQRFSDDGVVVLGATISKNKREIVAGPDVQCRGLVFLKDNEALVREIGRLFVSTIDSELSKEMYSITYIEEATKDIVFKAIRRALNKTPIIIPIVAEIE